LLVRTFKFVISPYTNGQTHLSHKEAFTASLSSFFAIALIFTLTMEVTNNQSAAALIAASTGASAFIIFTLPKSVFSQNWSVIAGHLTSAFIGVSCFKLLGSGIIATALSVALAVIGMHLLRCPHPPGGATALLAVIGGEPVTQLGYHYVIFPILINILTLLAIAHGFNWFFDRIYKNEDKLVVHQKGLDLGMDAVTLFNFTKIADDLRNNKATLHEGMLYSHSQHHFHASIRKVISITNKQVSYEVIHGFTKGKIDCIPYENFVAWVRFKVDENHHVA
jgi:CBS-domain-containing membrane protein